MKPRERRSLAWTLVGHGVVLMIVFLSAAFVHRPKIEYIDLTMGGGGSPGGGPPAPAARAERPEPPEPPQPERARENPPEPPKPAPEKQEFPTRKKPPQRKPPVVEKVKKPVAPKPKPKAKPKAAAKPKVQVSRKLVVRSQAKPAPAAEKGESPDEIRRRMLAQLRGDGEAGSTGSGSGAGGGDGNQFAGYLGGLQDNLYVAWQQPSAAEAGLKAVVKFHLERDGRLTNARIGQGSGNAEMDQSVLLAVKSVGRYEPWPEGFPPESAEIEVEFICKPL